jgi:hypothetical protein
VAFFATLSYNSMMREKGILEGTQERLQRILRGAFSGPPTALKDIPTRTGESRKLQRKKPQRRLRRQRKIRDRRKLCTHVGLSLRFW